MTKNYLVVEREGKTIDNLQIKVEDELVFTEVLSKSYNELKEYEDISDFIVAAMSATNSLFEEGDDQTLITLVGDDDVFIWSILVIVEEGDDVLHYAFVDWGKDGKKYRYEKI